MGDYNTPSLDDATFKALTRCGLMVPDALRELRMGDLTVRGSNLLGDARYDQILHMPTLKSRFTNFGGTLDFYGSDKFIRELFPHEARLKLFKSCPLGTFHFTDIEGVCIDVAEGETH